MATGSCEISINRLRTQKTLLDPAALPAEKKNKTKPPCPLARTAVDLAHVPNNVDVVPTINQPPAAYSRKKKLDRARSDCEKMTGVSGCRWYNASPCVQQEWSTHDEIRGVGVVGGRIVFPAAGGVVHLRRLHHGVVPGRELADEHLRQ